MTRFAYSLPLILCLYLSGCGSSPEPVASATNASAAATEDQSGQYDSAPSGGPSADEGGQYDSTPSGESSADEGDQYDSAPSGPMNEESESNMEEEGYSDPEADYEAQMSGENDESESDEAMYEQQYAAQMEEQMDESMGEEGYSGQNEATEGGLYDSENSSRNALAGGVEAVEEPAEPLPQDYLSKAIRAFDMGSEDQAHGLLMAHLVTEPSLAASTYEKAGWSKELRRPTWALKMGLGINIGAIRHGGDLHPVREGMGAPVDRSKDTSDVYTGTGGEPAEELEQHVGLVASVAAQMYNQRFTSGKLGQVFAQLGAGVEDIEPAKNSRRGGASNNVVEFYGEGEEDEGQIEESESMGPSDPDYSGDGETGTGEEHGAFDQMDSFGAAGAGVGKLPLIQTGLSYLGTGRANELVEKARKAGLDYFLQFDVAVKKNSTNGVVTNETGLRLVSTVTGKPVGRASAKVKNVEIYQAMQGRGTNLHARIEDALRGVFNGALASIALTEVPELSPQQAKSRIGSFIVSPPLNVLEALAEIRLYQSRGLVSDEDVDIAFDLLMGDDGLMLTSGPAKMHKELIAEMIPGISGL